MALGLTWVLVFSNKEQIKMDMQANQNQVVKRGRGRPPGRNKQIYKQFVGIYLPTKLKTKAQILAAEKELPLSVYLRGFIEAGIAAEVKQ